MSTPDVPPPAPPASPPKRGLGLRFVAMTVLYTLCVALAASVTFVQLRLHSELAALDRHFDEIEQGHLGNLAAALWAVDAARTQIAFDSLTRVQDLGRVELEDDAGQRWNWRARNLERIHAQREYPLQHTEVGESSAVGTLRVELSADRVYAERWRTALLVSMATVVTLLAAALIFLLLFRRHVGRHLHAMADYTGHLDLDHLGEPLTLAREAPARPDELDTVVQALNHMREVMRAQLSERVQLQRELDAHRLDLERLVAERTAELTAQSERAQHALQAVELAQAKLEQIARTDALTGLPNRRHMVELLERERARAQRGGRMFSILLCDIDYFKQVNDRFGHDGGDIALIETGRRLRTDLRAQDEAARWGGEEFLVLLPETDREGAMVAAGKLRERVRAHPVLLAGDRVALSITIGVACWNGEEGIDSLVVRADRALYVGKREGRDRAIAAA